LEHSEQIVTLDLHRTDHHEIGPKEVLIAQLFKPKIN
jgi:hypothetical protein